jgi:hypothetical protein
MEIMERVEGIEPSSSAWKAVALPLSYTRGCPFLAARRTWDGWLEVFRQDFTLPYRVCVASGKCGHFGGRQLGPVITMWKQMAIAIDR